MTSQAMSGFWSLWIIVLTLGTIVFCWWLLYANREKESVTGDVQTTGHVADGIEEYDNPLPRWWFIMFVVTLVFGIVYLILYPGLGNFKGVLGWTQQGQWEREMDHAEEFYAPIFQQYAQFDIPTLARDPEAMQVADRLYQNNCAVCHGSSARGGYGFPNLTDNNWLYGGDPEVIRTSIYAGRNGLMTPWVDMLGDQGVDQMVHYVMRLSSQSHDAAKADAAAPMFQAICAACHGAEGQGSAAMGLNDIGAPDLTRNIWMYLQPGQDLYDSIDFTIRHGRNGLMPAQARYLDYGVELPANFSSMSPEEKARILPKVHLVTAYIYSLNQ